MRILGLETSSLRGSVALLEGESPSDAVVCGYAFHEEPNRHAERLLGLVDECLKSANWDKNTIDRVAVGVGPGAFTGIRVGLALAQGLMLGLGVDGVGIGSLRSVAAGLEASDSRLRVVLRDARRDEYFLAAYDAGGNEVVAPYAIPQKDALSTVREKFSGQDIVVVGTPIEGLPCELNELSEEPDARSTARIGMTLSPEEAPVSPHYVRGPNVVKPKLPPSPLAQPRVD